VHSNSLLCVYITVLSLVLISAILMKFCCFKHDDEQAAESVSMQKWNSVWKYGRLVCYRDAAAGASIDCVRSSVLWLLVNTPLTLMSAI